MYKTLLSSTLPLAAGALMAASATLQAEPAVYRDGSMKVPQAAVIGSNENSYYTDVTLGFGSDGTLRVTGATLNHLVGVDTVEAQVTQTLATQEVSLAVSGNLSVPCKQLLDPAMSFRDDTFTVVLAESNLGPAESCIQVLEPFDTRIELDVEDLDAGTYNVDVNGVMTQFTL